MKMCGRLRGAGEIEQMREMDEWMEGWKNGDFAEESDKKKRGEIDDPDKWGENEGEGEGICKGGWMDDQWAKEWTGWIIGQ
jgi:hypothetical protein